jgi:hypothetical protein
LIGTATLLAILGCDRSPSVPAGAAAWNVTRLVGHPIIFRDMPGLQGEEGRNINGPSLIRAPDWIDRPLGRYYLYFAHHRGQHIRLAFADRPEGPWTIHPEAVLRLADTAAQNHIASPDVHVDEEKRELRLYFHGAGPGGLSRQVTFLATSKDGRRFHAFPEILGPSYFRVFRHAGQYYAIARKDGKTGLLLRSQDGVSRFEEGPEVLPRMRHAAVLEKGDTLWLFFSRVGDAPESILFSRMNLTGSWTTWKPSDPVRILEPEKDYEGIHEALEPSLSGAARGPKRQLRDPAIFVEGDRTFLLYSVAGESGIALAELR